MESATERALALTVISVSVPIVLQLMKKRWPGHWWKLEIPSSLRCKTALLRVLLRAYWIHCVRFSNRQLTDHSALDAQYLYSAQFVRTACTDYDNLLHCMFCCKYLYAALLTYLQLFFLLPTSSRTIFKTTNDSKLFHGDCKTGFYEIHSFTLLQLIFIEVNIM